MKPEFLPRYPVGISIDVTDIEMLMKADKRELLYAYDCADTRFNHGRSDRKKEAYNDILRIRAELKRRQINEA